jgi:hypothetical protein
VRERTLFYLGLFLSLVTGICGYTFTQRPWDVIETIIIVNIFILTLQLYFHLRDGDPTFGSAIREIRSHMRVAALVAEFLNFLAAALRLEDPFLNDQIFSFLRNIRSVGQELQNGVLDIDLRPGGVFFRETDIVEHAINRVRATSYVSIPSYWQAAPGNRILRKNRTKIAAGLIVERIFIEHPDDSPVIRDVIDSNESAGATVYVVKSDAIDHGLVRDFAIVDDGNIAVELILEDRNPARAVFYSATSEEGRAKIAELGQVWSNLICHAEKVGRPRDKQHTRADHLAGLAGAGGSAIPRPAATSSTTHSARVRLASHS